MRNQIHERIIKLKSQSKRIVRFFTLTGIVLGFLFAFTSHPIGGTNAQSITCPAGQHLATGDVCIYNDKDIVIEATATATQQTLTINKYFNNAYTVDRGDGITGNLTANTTHTYSTTGIYNIILSLSGGANRWTFQDIDNPLVPKAGTTMTGAKIIYMPSLAEGFGNNTTEPGDYFFKGFNNRGALISLPERSFDTSYISGTVGNEFFKTFNELGDISNLPGGSFDISNITAVGNDFFSRFNNNGALTSLPDGSFNTSNISGTVGNNFFRTFNQKGGLTSLPDGSFDISNITAVGDYFFGHFNSNGSLTSLPDGSFNTSNISSVGNRFFASFNGGSQITSLPDGSFNTSNISGNVGDYFFFSFNYKGKLTSLPTGSFDISNITSVGTEFISSFNEEGSLTSLPDGSFNTSNITTVLGDYFLGYFNAAGNLTSLPNGSFNLSNITQFNGSNFFESFNEEGRITNLPNSFKLSSAAYDKTGGYQNAFNSPNYTLNKNVSDLVAGVTAPSNDRNTFSDNQPGRCGVHENRLYSTDDACNITYNYNGGTAETITKKYTADTTGVVAGSGIDEPNKTSYNFNGWYTESVGGTEVITVSFPQRDGETLYAHRVCQEGTHEEGDICVDNEQRTGCAQIGEKPSNSIYNVINVTGVWNSGTNRWDIPSCNRVCVTGYHTGFYNNSCESNIIMTGCIETGVIPEHSIYNVVNVTGVWNSGINKYDIPNCSWMCETNNDSQNNTNTEREDITICDPNDNNACITIMDRNLGATNTGTNTASSTIGNYYEWGNNYGFIGSKDPYATSTKVPWDNKYNNSGYYGTEFITSTSEPFDYWSDNQNHPGLRGGANDPNENRGYDTTNMVATNLTGRQGPCPEGYHVPSAGEWGTLIRYRADTYATGIAIGAYPFYNININSSEFRNQFNLSMAGNIHNYHGTIMNVGGNGGYWTSSKSGSRAVILLVNNNSISITKASFASGRPLRCFKNIGNITENSNNSYHTEDNLSCTLNTKDVECTQEGKPDHSTYIIDNVPVTWSGTRNTGEWNQAENCAYSCDAGYEMDENGDCKKSNVQVTFIANPSTFSDGRFSGGDTSKTLEYFFATGGYYAAVTEEIQIPQKPHEEDGNGNLLTGWMFEGWYLDTGYSTASRWTGLNVNTTYTGITLYARYLPFKDKTVTRDGVTFTIIDRNLGALDYSSGYSYGTGNEQSNNNKIGLFFQRGNNFGFPNIGAPKNILSGILIENFTNKEWGPGNYYFNGTFISRSNSSYNWSSENNGNLWGGNNIGNSDTNKQGPCPNGYHIPSSNEWLATELLFNKRAITEQGNMYCSIIDNGSHTDAYYCMPAALGLPFAGSLYHTSGSRVSIGTHGFYSSSNSYNTSYLYGLYFYRNYINSQSNEGRQSSAYTLRCFKDTTGVTLSYDTIGGNTISGSTERRWFAKDTAPANPTRAGSTFAGWYKDTGYTNEFIFSGDTYISEDTTIYAKWTCNSGFFMDEGGYCMKENISVTFIANPETFPDGQFSGGTTEKTLEYLFTHGGYYAAVTEEIQIPQNPHEYDSSGNLLTGWMFEGWYLDTGYCATSRRTGLSVDTPYTGITLYARYLPFKDKTVTFDGVTFTIMDRNLGALEYSSGYSYGSDNEQNSNSRIGLYFQRGNNFGFPNADADGKRIIYSNNILNIFVTNLGNKTRGPGNYYFNGTFICRNNFPFQWDNENDINLWGGSGETQNKANLDTDKQGPCPEGYHVPSRYERSAAENLFTLWQNTIWGMEYCTSLHGENTGIIYCMPAILGLPFPGYMGRNNGSTKNGIGTYGDYWSANSKSDGYAYIDFFHRTLISPKNYPGEQSYGLSLRCFKNTPDLILSFDSNGGSNVPSKTGFKRWNPITSTLYKPTNPTKTGSTFAGWYTDTGYTQEFIFSGNTYISEDTTLYAKWTCNSGYIESLDGQSCEKHNIATFNTSGVITSGTITKSCTIHDNNIQSCDITAPNLTGYVILGRSTNSSSNTAEYNVGDIISLTGDMTYYAITSPAIEFTGSTPANHTTQVENYFTSQIDITTSNLSGFSSVLDGNEISLYDDSLVLMYNFDNVESLGESETIVKDLSKYGNDGIVRGQATPVVGKYNTGYYFPGNSYVNAGNNPSLFMDEELTISLWVKFLNLDYENRSGYLQTFVKKGHPDAAAGTHIPHSGFWFSYDNRRKRNDSYFNYTCFGNSTGGAAGGGNNLGHISYKFDNYERYHLTLTVGDLLAKLYINGVYIGEKSLLNLNLGNSIDNLIVGPSSSYGSGIVLDEIYIYNRALSQEEIDTLYHSNLSKTALNKWTYTIGFTGLAGGIHTYGGIMSDISGNKSVSRAINICTTGYHTEDGTTCVENTKTVTCDYSGVPAHANYTTGDSIQITWSGTWNTGEWPQIESCPWSCEIGYTKSPDGQSCLSNVLPYTVNHYQQNTGDNGYTLFETENKTGLYDSLTQATSKTYQGFIAQPIEQQIIQGNDTHVDIYYDRNIYTINIDLNGGTGPTSFTGKYGDTVVPPEITKSGYSIKKRVPALPETMPLNGFSSKPVRVLTDGSISISVNPNKNTLDLSIRGTSNSSRELTGAFTNDYFTISDTKGEENGYHATLSIGNLVGNDNVNHIIPASNVQVKTDGIVRLSGAPSSEVGLTTTMTNWRTATGQVTYFTRGDIVIDDECKPGEYGINLELKITVPSYTIPDNYHGTITYTLYED